MTIYSLDALLLQLEIICCSMSSSNCCFLTWIQISQEAGQVVWYAHLCRNFPVCCDPHSQTVWHSELSRSRCFSGTVSVFRWSSRCWQFDLWFLCGTQQETSPRKQLKGWDFSSLSNNVIIEKKKFVCLGPDITWVLSLKDKIQSTFSFGSPKRRFYHLLWWRF